MKKMLNLFVLFSLAAPLVASGGQTNAPTADAPVNPDNLFTNTIVAKGKGVSVTRNQLDEEIVRIKANAAAQGQMVPPDLEEQVLNGFINRQLLMAKTTPADKAKGKQDFDATLQKIKTSQKLSDEEFNQKLSQQLRLMGLTREEWEKQGIEQATLPIVLARELNITITDEQAKKFYQDNPAKFEQPEMVRVAHILIGTKDRTTGADLTDEQKAAKMKQIQDLLKRARAGEDFSKLAKEYSEDPGSKDNGGEYTFPRGQMMPEFEAAAFSLNTNQVSDVVTTPYGYHIIKLYEKIPAKKVEFEKAEPDIKEYLLSQEIKKQFNQYTAKLRKEADVQILDDKLKQTDLFTPGDTIPSTPSGSSKP
jgi:peptidyl-prolyl cis-trans isomerase C